MQRAELIDELQTIPARVESVIYIAGARGDGDAIARPLRELFEEEDETLEGIFGPLPTWLKQALTARRDAGVAISEWLTTIGKLGFIVEMSTPVAHHTESGSTWSWGHYQRAWFYAETLDEALQSGLAWARDFHEVR